MRRVMGLALVLVVGAGAPTAATNASYAGDRIAGATHQSATTAAPRRAVPEHASLSRAPEPRPRRSCLGAACGAKR
jgi:hypothetical protein